MSRSGESRAGRQAATLGAHLRGAYDSARKIAALQLEGAGRLRPGGESVGSGGHTGVSGELRKLRREIARDQTIGLRRIGL